MSKFWEFTATGSSDPWAIDGPYWSCQLLGTTTSGNVSATVIVEATNTPGDSGSWQTLDTLTLTAGASPQRDFGGAGPIAWDRVRFRCTAIAGTGAKLEVVFNAL